MWKIFEKLFKKTIVRPLVNDDELVCLCKAGSGYIKPKMNIKVEEGDTLVVVYYNKVYDILGAGEYKLDMQNVPKVYLAQRKKLNKNGILEKIEVQADLYFVSSKVANKIPYKTDENIVKKENNEKVKFTLKGWFSYKISDVKKLMEFAASEFAIIKGKRLNKEISYIFSSFLRKEIEKNVSLSDIFASPQKVCNDTLLNLNEKMKDFGVEIQDFEIIDTKTKNIDVKLRKKEERKNKDELLKEAEEVVNNADFVYVEKSLPQKTLEIEKKENNFQNYDNIFIKEDINNFKKDLPHEEQNAPYVLKEKENKKLEQKKENFVFCKCCGTKNEGGSEFCKICKSRLY